MDKVETDMKRLVYFYQGKYLKGREATVLRGKTAALTP